jgi:hypothetical protein
MGPVFTRDKIRHQINVILYEIFLYCICTMAGERRFRPPEALDEEDNWQRPRDFNANPPQCVQTSAIFGRYSTEISTPTHRNVYRLLQSLVGILQRFHRQPTAMCTDFCYLW